MAAMAARQPTVDPCRELVTRRGEGSYGAGSENVTYTYEDNYKLRLHKGNADWRVELIDPGNKKVARVASIGRGNQYFEDQDARGFRVGIHEQAKMMQPRTREELATIMDLARVAYQQVGKQSGGGTPVGMTPRGPAPMTPGLPPFGMASSARSSKAAPPKAAPATDPSRDGRLRAPPVARPRGLAPGSAPRPLGRQ